ncbi:hypothetical protein DD238_007035 [Peronospora effusa]|uniref:Uncharacterized protein n=1 Tax=Peronospora effusa TaxID=542832 RepID=A0A3M6VNX7_9STRA|nr:hypothetical protein DD238_007035 [Peronospora effusa]RQM10954.1 hypothetical protein DD237_008442 [Peronospora effusa]
MTLLLEDSALPAAMQANFDLAGGATHLSLTKVREGYYDWKDHAKILTLKKLIVPNLRIKEQDFMFATVSAMLMSECHLRKFDRMVTICAR